MNINKCLKLILFFKKINCIKINYIKKINIIIILKYFLLFLLIFIIFKSFNYNVFYNKINLFNTNNHFINHKFLTDKELDYTNKIFAIITIKCESCALFSFYNQYLRCMDLFLKQGYIPIIDLISFGNIFNQFNISSSSNPWELYFYQPYGYTYENVIKNGKIKNYFNCDPNLYENPNKYNIILNKVLTDYWHNIANNYIPVKNEILKEANIIKKILFQDSNNVLGVLVRGTDYIAIKPKDHAIQPRLSTIIHNIKNMNKKNNYDWIFLATEDDIIDKYNIK